MGLISIAPSLLLIKFKRHCDGDLSESNTLLWIVSCNIFIYSIAGPWNWLNPFRRIIVIIFSPTWFSRCNMHGISNSMMSISSTSVHPLSCHSLTVIRKLIFNSTKTHSHSASRQFSTFLPWVGIILMKHSLAIKLEYSLFLVGLLCGIS